MMRNVCKMCEPHELLAAVLYRAPCRLASLILSRCAASPAARAGSAEVTHLGASKT